MTPLLLWIAQCVAQSPSPSPTPERPKIRVSSGVEAGLLKHEVKPVYPPEAKKKHIKGDVVLQVVVDQTGSVASTKVVRGDAMLTEAAVAAVKQWKYKPYLLNGEPIDVETMVTVHFGK